MSTLRPERTLRLFAILLGTAGVVTIASECLFLLPPLARLDSLGADGRSVTFNPESFAFLVNAHRRIVIGLLVSQSLLVFVAVALWALSTQIRRSTSARS